MVKKQKKKGKEKRRRNFRAQIQLPAEYRPSFSFFLCAACPNGSADLFHRTVSDKIADSTDYHLGTLKFHERSLNLLIIKSEKYL